MMEDGPCYYCGEPTSSWAGNPGLWPLLFPHSDEPGVVKSHHISCVTERLNRVERAETLATTRFDLLTKAIDRAQKAEAQVASARETYEAYEERTLALEGQV